MPLRLCSRSAAVVLLLACAREPGSDTARDSTQTTPSAPVDTTALAPVPASPAPLDSIGGSFVTWAVDALALVSTGEGLAAWRARFPRDSIALFSRRHTRRYPNTGSDDFPLGAWCARATSRVRFGNGPPALRRVYFYPAPLAPGAVLPGADDAQSFMATECRVGLVLIHMLEGNRERGSGLAWVLRGDMEARFGAGAAPAHSSFAFARPRGREWLVGPMGLGVTYLEFNPLSTQPGSNGNGGGHNVTDEDWRGLVALAYRSHPAIGDDQAQRLDEEDEPPAQDPAAMLRLGIEASGLDGAATEPLRALFVSLNVAEAPGEKGGPFAVDSFAPLAPWLATAVGLPPARQAAALFAADVVVQLASSRRLLPTDSVTRARFDGLGASLTYNPFEKAYFYAGGLRRRAFELRPQGELGDALFALLVQHAPTCTSLGWIATEAEHHIGATRGQQMRGEAHLVAARALADSFVVSGNQTLRDRAIEHYQSALGAQFEREVQQRAWREGWRLAVGLGPMRLRYYCSVPD